MEVLTDKFERLVLDLALSKTPVGQTTDVHALCFVKETEIYTISLHRLDSRTVEITLSLFPDYYTSGEIKAFWNTVGGELFNIQLLWPNALPYLNQGKFLCETAGIISFAASATIDQVTDREVVHALAKDLARNASQSGSPFDAVWIRMHNDVNNVTMIIREWHERSFEPLSPDEAEEIFYKEWAPAAGGRRRLKSKLKRSQTKRSRTRSKSKSKRSRSKATSKRRRH